MKKKQTAVEWFIEQLEQKGDAWENASIRRIQISVDVSDYLELKIKAKAMEREQIIESAERLKWVDYSLVKSGEVYYTETYGGNK